MAARIKEICFPVFNDYKVHVEITTDLDKSLKSHEETKYVKLYGDEEGMAVHIKDEFRSFVFFRKDTLTAGTVAHEAWHVVRRIFEMIGSEYENEIVGYHIGYLTDEIYKFSRRKHVVHSIQGRRNKSVGKNKKVAGGI